MTQDPMHPHRTVAALRDAIADLCTPRSALIWRDPTNLAHGAVTDTARVSAPSLLDQLTELVHDRGPTGEGRGVPGARSPLDLEALDLAREIDADARLWCRLGGIAVTDHTRHRLSALHLAASMWPGSTEELHGMAVTLSRYATRVRALLVGVRLTRGLRGLSCPSCGADYVTERRADGQHYRTPSLVLHFTDTGRLRGVGCQHCPSWWWPGEDLHRLAGGADIA